MSQASPPPSRILRAAAHKKIHAAERREADAQRLRIEAAELERQFQAARIAGQQSKAVTP